MDKSIIQLLDIIKFALNNSIYNEELIDEELLFKYAQENGLSGFIFTALDQNKISEAIYNKFQQEFYLYTTKDIRQLKTINEITELFNEHHIDHIFLKGSVLKKVYPETYMRSMGDIDILIKEYDLDKVHEILENSGYNNWHNSSHHDCFKKGKDIFLEIHPKLNSEFDSKYDVLFNNVWNMAKVVNNHQYEFIPEYNLVYLLYHTVKHFFSSGVGLRTILDIGLFIRKYHEDINYDLLNTLLKDIDLTLFFKNMIWLNSKYFSLNDLMPLLNDYELDNSTYEQVTSYIIQSGVHGHGKDFNSYICGMTAKSIKKNNISKGKRVFIIRLIFPKYQTMVSIYPYLQKHKWLLPYAWLSRICRLMFLRTKRSIYKLKKLKVDNEQINENVKLYKKLGLK